MYTVTLPLETDVQILEAFRSGERDQAATAFVRRHQDFVYAVALRHVRNREDARDVAQDTFIKALKGIEKFKGDSTLQTWLYRITTNTCMSMLRRMKFLSFFAAGEGEDERDVPAKQRTPAEQAEQSDFEAFFDVVLSTLPPKQRETFSLRYFNELSYEEISAMVGTSVGALKANYHWATKKIADQLRKSEYYERWYEDE
jgi:RNA polymerase sigma factor (sigma-70 family)